MLKDDKYITDVPLPCPGCEKTYAATVRFLTGPNVGRRYRLGESLDWSTPGPAWNEKARGAARYEEYLSVAHCQGCVTLYTRHYLAIRDELSKAGRLQRLVPVDREDGLASPDPALRDFLTTAVDGIYPANQWIPFELRRLGAPISGIPTVIGAKLVIREGRLAEVVAVPPSLPEKVVSLAEVQRAWGSREQVLSEMRDCCPAHSQEPFHDADPGIANDDVALLCRQMEFVPPDPELRGWLLKNIIDNHRRRDVSPALWQTVAASLNTLAVLKDRVALQELKELARPEQAESFLWSLIEIGKACVKKRIEEAVPARVAIQIRWSDGGPGQRRGEFRGFATAAPDLSACPPV